MTQRVVYNCDGCGKEIGAKKHISMQLYTGNGASGIAIPPTSSFKKWRVIDFIKNFVHFCSGKCVATYFGNILKNDKTK